MKNILQKAVIVWSSLMQLRQQMGRFFVFGMSILLILTGGCAARGTAPPVIEFSGSTVSHNNDPTLRIATVNLWGVSVLGFDFSDHIDERFAAMAQRLAGNEPKLDLVLLQEAWKHKARRALLTHDGVMRNFPYRVDIAEQPGGAGLVILSRLPIEIAHFHRFQTQGQCLKLWQGDCISGKGILIVRLSLGGHSLWVGNTHLIACYTHSGEPKTACDKQDLNGNYRWKQTIEVRQVIESLVGEDAAMLGGDFNFTLSSRYSAAMTSPEIPAEASPDLSAADNGRGWTAIKETVPDPNRLDYIWTRPGTEFRWQAQENVHPIFTRPVALRSGELVQLSDHPVLMTTLCLVQVGDPGNRCLSF